MDRDGSHAKQITKENFRLLNNSVWTPMANTRLPVNTSQECAHPALVNCGCSTSAAAGTSATPKKNDQQDLNEPSVSPDGRYVYYSEEVFPGGYFQYNKDPNGNIFVIKRFDREKGSSEVVTGERVALFVLKFPEMENTLAFAKTCAHQISIVPEESR